MKPIIVVLFQTNGMVEWKSAGWADNEKLMGKAQRAIHRGKDPGQVTDLLRKAGFIVVEEVPINEA